MVYASVSGGIDSTVMYHLIHDLYPDVPGIFVNTRMEFPEIARFARTLPNVREITPAMTPAQVFMEYGYPVAGGPARILIRSGPFPAKAGNHFASGKVTLQDISRTVSYARKGSEWALRRFDGQRPDGTPSEWYAQRHGRWKRLLSADFAISDRCCRWFKPNLRFVLSHPRQRRGQLYPR